MMKKEDILKTFAYSFLVSFIAILLVIYVISSTSQQFLIYMASSWRVGWIIFVVSSVLALSFTLFNYLENWRIYQNFSKDVKMVLAGGQPDNNDLVALAKKINDLTHQLQKASKDDAVKQVEIVTEERQRISRELHDSVSQQLFAATMILSGVAGNKNLDKDQLASQLNMILKILHEAQNEMRALLLHLRPVELDGKTLVEGITALVDELQLKIDGKINWKYDDISLDKGVEDNVFRIVQELLSNALRHSKAKVINISLLEAGSNVLLSVEDDGVGFDASQEKSASYGLKNIKERSLLLGGDAKIISAPNQGTSIEIRIPKNDY